MAEVKANPKDAVTKIFNEIKIGTVAIVDDDFVPDNNFEKMFGIIKTLRSSGRIEFLNGLIHSIDFTSEEIVWKDPLRSYWLGLEHEEISSLLHKLKIELEESGQEPAIDLMAPYSLSRLFEGICEIIPLAPDEWDRIGNDLANGATNENKLLVIFDNKLDRDDEGILLLKKLKKAFPKDSIICGLISYKIKRGDETRKWDELAKRYDIPKDQFLAIAKETTEDDLKFVSELKLVTLNLYCKKLKEKFSTFVLDSHKKSISKIKNLDIRDFDQIIFRSSAVGSVWELDTLLRVYHLFHREVSNRKILENRKSNLSEIINSIRNLSQVTPIKKAGEVGYTKENSIEIQRLELYDNANVINKFHQPLELGDIFKARFNREISHYILIVQPCDAHILNYGERKCNEGLLVKIESGINPNLNQSHRFCELMFLNNKKCYADFNEEFAVNLKILDLCIFNTKGKLIFMDKMDSPDTLTSGLSHCFENRKREFLPKVKKIENKDQIPSLSLRPLAECSLTANHGFEYKLERIGRYRMPYSFELLSRYAQFKSRAAFEHDLTSKKL